MSIGQKQSFLMSDMRPNSHEQKSHVVIHHVTLENTPARNSFSIISKPSCYTRFSYACAILDLRLSAVDIGCRQTNFFLSGLQKLLFSRTTERNGRKFDYTWLLPFSDHKCTWCTYLDESPWCISSRTTFSCTRGLLWCCTFNKIANTVTVKSVGSSQGVGTNTMRSSTTSYVWSIVMLISCESRH